MFALNYGIILYCIYKLYNNLNNYIYYYNHYQNYFVLFSWIYFLGFISGIIFFKLILTKVSPIAVKLV